MSSSIDKLASYLSKDKKNITRSEYVGGEAEFELLTRKGVFPYEYVDCFEKLNERCLPPKNNFFSSLRGEEISEDDYTHALNIWNSFSIETLGQFSDLYLKTDVLLLADIFENFRNTCLQTYKLDPLHYFSAPGLAFDAMLKITDVQLELLTDIDQVMFIERGIRGGITQCSTRYAKANNKYMKEGYRPELESTYLMYFDVNSLYGATMCEFLPYGEFSFVDEDSFETLDILNHPDNAEIGYILDCDLNYPTNIHSFHKDLPLAPEHRTPPNGKFKKLLLTLYSKQNYVLHYRNLKQYIKHGLRLDKINRVLRFRQSPWLKKYIDLNTQKRQESTNEFDINFYKLMVNCVFGKLMENVRKYKDVHLVNKWGGRYGAGAYISKPNFKSCMLFDDNEDLAIIEMNRLEVLLNKPIYAGLTVLDVSKTILYDFHYNFVLKEFKDRAKLLYTDTDSLIYSFSVPDIYESIRENIDKFDTSNYNHNNVFGIPLVNKKVPGLMKDENNGKIMLEFVGLRAKMYSYLVDGKVFKRSKGSTYASIREITLEDYKNSIFNNAVVTRPQYLIKSRKHLVFTIKQNKVVLSPYDDKRQISLDCINTLPWGYNFST
ncbi:uncharacterized protein LOC116179983 [Photinus pyralis]|uniref:uncharacterized protein LOC116160138 n=1 Tax=Photinus pyralis TaxID=7054 RepID=UPI0012677FD1|nr:uncharacterized protein LOC116160138 [Photinus pyralis]XP_031336346.1 uncharacterized protein LOC116165800 [Photinus pyralis]XP_031355665.1 uncharacterized protein LOC116179983 [Photinus pyralis]